MPKKALVCEAKRLNVYKDEGNEKALKKSVEREWRREILAELSGAGVDVSSVKKEDVEDLYNLYLSLKWVSRLEFMGRQGALVQMSDPLLNPREVSFDALRSFMKLHHIAIPEPASQYG